MRIDFKNEKNLLEIMRELVDSNEYCYEDTKFLLLFISKDSKSILKDIFKKIDDPNDKIKLLADIQTVELGAV